MLPRGVPVSKDCGNASRQKKEVGEPHELGQGTSHGGDANRDKDPAPNKADGAAARDTLGDRRGPTLPLWMVSLLSAIPSTVRKAHERTAPEVQTATPNAVQKLNLFSFLMGASVGSSAEAYSIRGPSTGFSDFDDMVKQETCDRMYAWYSFQ